MKLNRAARLARHETCVHRHVDALLLRCASNAVVVIDG
jgi:hypothetical protein